MKITIDVPKNIIKELISVTDSNSEEDAIIEAIRFTVDRY